MTKVRCSFCTKFDGINKCLAKDTRVSSTKKRRCTKYDGDVEAIIGDEIDKAKDRNKIPVYKQTYRFYEGIEGAQYVLSNPRTAVGPKLPNNMPDLKRNEHGQLVTPDGEVVSGKAPTDLDRQVNQIAAHNSTARKNS